MPIQDYQNKISPDAVQASAPEEWKDVAGYEGFYSISSFGRAKSFYKGGKILKPTEKGPIKFGKGYLIYTLHNINGETKTFYAHKLVMESFIGGRPKGSQINHKDGDKHNNRLNNLEYVSPLENVRHSIKIGHFNPHTLKPYIAGSKNKQSKLKESEVITIRENHRNGIKTRFLAKEFNVDRTVIQKIVKRKSWVHI